MFGQFALAGECELKSSSSQGRPNHETRNMTPLVAANAHDATQWIGVGELGQWLLSVRNYVSRGIGQPARVSRRVGR